MFLAAGATPAAQDRSNAQGYFEMKVAQGNYQVSVSPCWRIVEVRQSELEGTPFYVLLKDVSIFLAWCNGVFRRTVVWRGNRLRVEHGSLLRPPETAEGSADLATAQPALVSSSWTRWARRRRHSNRTAA